MDGAVMTIAGLTDFPKAFGQQSQATPHATCLVFEGREWTYAEVNAWANQIANWLMEQGYTPGRPIGMCLDRSSFSIAAMIGIMRAGCAFVPLDPEYPRNRLQFMVEDANIPVVICEPQYRNLWEVRGVDRPELKLIEPQEFESDPGARGVGFDSMVSPELDPDSLAYIMYTSGSTGNPKGVQIEHRAMMTYCYADIDVYHLTSNDRTLQFSTLNFDIAIEEIFPPLLVGGTVVIRPRQRSNTENELLHWVESYEITALHLATAYWHEWVDLLQASQQRVPATLRLVIATGEKVSPGHYGKWLAMCEQDVLWCNAYGPTETTVTATVFIPEAGWAGASMPIGKPLPGYEAWILGEGDRPLGEGETGDLYIGGAALSRGYLNCPEKNAAAFRKVDLPGLPQHRLYKTGDLARWLSTGDIEFAGRIDHQIKLGSYRIEPGEIEFQIGSCPGVLDSLVVCVELEGLRSLVAYIAVGDLGLSASQVANHLKTRLPAYMLPVRYCMVKSFPKTINGKIDRPSLPPPETGEMVRETTHSAARSPIERLLVDIWQEVLGIDQIGIEDDFFSLGGSSLLVTRVIARIRQHYDLAIPVRDFFANPTIASIANQLQRRLGNERENGCESLNDFNVLRMRERLPLIKPSYFTSGSQSLFGVRYQPRNVSGAVGQEVNKTAVLICGSLGHEYARAHRNLQQLAVQLAQVGCDVFRFDYSGTGNSTGQCSDGDADIWARDIAAAACYLREAAKPQCLVVLGVRLGATLASQYVSYAQFDSSRSCRMVFPDRLVFWDPVVRGEQFLNTLDTFHERSLASLVYYSKRRRARGDQRFGLQMSESKTASLKQLDMTTALNSPVRPTLVVTSRDYREVILQPESSSEAEDLGAGLTHIATADAIHWEQAQYTESAFSSPRIQRCIVDWIAGGRS
jgi:amino acid adenylation domain-containing protein